MMSAAYPYAAPKPLNEVARLAALRSYCVLDTPADLILDQLTSLAAVHFGAPIVLISLVDEHRQFFKSKTGMSASSGDRDTSFCAHCVFEGKTMVVPNAIEDVRFKTNPMVTGDPSIRFYAGAPLITKDGYRLGTFCVIDCKPRSVFGPEAIASLERFAAIASEFIEQRLLPQALEQAARKNMELEKRAQEESAANQAKSDFLSNISHEIRTPMNGVLGMIQLLMGTCLNQEQYHYAEVAQSSGRALLTLIDDVLDLSKIEAGKMSVESLDFDLSKTLYDVAEIWRLQAQVKGLTFLLQTSPQMPRNLRGDPGRLRQVLNNLISNAIKFTEQGFVKVSVEPDGADVAGARLRFSVEDTGIGVSDEQAKALFQSFTQADPSTTRKYGGTGLGLFICKRLVQLMGGSIGMTSEASVGTTFHFTLVLERQLETKETGLASSPKVIDLDTRPGQHRGAQGVEPGAPRPMAKYAPAYPPRRILVAEDNVTNQIVIRAQLRKLGYEAEIVANGKEVLQAFEQGCFDLILMDCEMPVMDGYEATRRLRAFGHKDLPIIAVTAHAMQSNRQACLEAGMDYCLTKPLEMERLARVLSTWCDKLEQKAVTVARNVHVKSQSTPDAEVFNATLLLERLMGDLNLASIVLEGFLDDCPKQLALLQSRIEQTDRAGIRLHAHSLKGAAAAVSASYLTSIASELEFSPYDEGRWQPLLRQAEDAFEEFKSNRTVRSLAGGTRNGSS